jgi:hypothetical protein
MALSAGIAAPREGAPAGRRVVAAAALAVLTITWTRVLVVAARQWDAAGRITTTIHAQLRADAAARSARGLHFFCVPDFYGTATVYLTYFEEHVRDAVGAQVDVIRHREDGPRSMGDPPARPAAGERAYRWDQAAWRLEPVAPPRDGSPDAGAICPPVPEVVRP